MCWCGTFLSDGCVSVVPFYLIGSVGAVPFYLIGCVSAVPFYLIGCVSVLPFYLMVVLVLYISRIYAFLFGGCGGYLPF